MRASRGINTINGLHAAGPACGSKKNLALFGQFVGGWKLEARWFLSEGAWRNGKGELHFGWILDGRAIQDVWSSRKRGRNIPAGTTLRYYDPKIDAWHCVWFSPQQGVVRTFVARQVGDEIVLEGLSADGRAERWIFSDITPTSFRWRAVEWIEEKKDWRLTEEMYAKRIQPPHQRASDK
jgi:hypothetical protein